MARLTRNEIQDGAARLSQWRAPSEMKNAAQKLKEYLGSEDLFNQPGVQFVLEAWAAAIFAETRFAHQVRLTADEWPDFELRFSNGTEEKFEFVEADLLGRRRGDEYKAAAERGFPVEDDPVEDWVARAEQVPGVLRDRALKKAAKRYPVTAGLLIYLNINEYGVRQREIEAAFTSSVEPARSRFTTIWILWKDRSYRAW